MTLGTLNISAVSPTGKSKAFSAELLAYVLAPGHWELGQSEAEHLRPVLFAYAATQDMSKAFTANLRLGEPAVLAAASGLKASFELPRSAGHRFDCHQKAGASLVLAYLPDLFSLKPGVLDTEELAFLCLPTAAWVRREAAILANDLGSEAEEAALAAHFVAHLDHRSPLPIPNDLQFHLSLYRAALATDWCHPTSGSLGAPSPFLHAGLESIGFHPRALACSVDHNRFRAFLSAQIAQSTSLLEVYLNGETRLPSPGWLLPDSSTSPSSDRVARELRTA